MTAIKIDDEATWPASLHVGLEHVAHARNGGDDSIRELETLLAGHSVVGYHCSRLTEAEISRIGASGMGTGGVSERVRLLAAEGVLSEAIAAELIANPWLHMEDESECWFFLSPPHEQGEQLLRTFVGSWGGYRHFHAYRDDPEIGPLLRGIGTPCIVVADVPVASLRSPRELSLSLLWRFLGARGRKVTCPPCDGCLARPLAPAQIRSIWRFPEAQFVTMTKCASWYDRIPSVSGGRRTTPTSPGYSLLN